ncbi:type II toxin-antitoxin system VapC family toxin [Patescibacteria group bacterium]|nr:type II toxin-antitoxin system VapC family toxin [Patescibacteria group bacterium]
MEIITLDTNAVIDYFKGVSDVVKKIDGLREKGVRFAVSVIVELELLSLPNLDSLDELQILDWLTQIYVLPVDSAIARQAAEIRREMKIKTPDAIVAATAVFLGGKFISRDKKLQKIKGLKLI